MYKTLQVHVEGSISIITVNRPEKLNALNRQVLEDLNRVIDDVEQNDVIKSVIITGAGSKAFVAGADISEFVGLNAEEGEKLAKAGQQLFKKIEESNKPIIAAVNGFALGGGCELAMACHFRIASENARFGQPEVNLGLIPGYGGTQRLVQLVGKGRAIELMLTGNIIDAQTALNYGLVNHVIEQSQLLNKAKEILDIINAKAPLAIAGCIQAANSVFDFGKDGFETESRIFGKCFATEDMKEGTQAFLEKRKANFKGL